MMLVSFQLKVHEIQFQALGFKGLNNFDQERMKANLMEHVCLSSISIFRVAGCTRIHASAGTTRSRARGSIRSVSVNTGGNTWQSTEALFSTSWRHFFMKMDSSQISLEMAIDKSQLVASIIYSFQIYPAEVNPQCKRILLCFAFYDLASKTLQHLENAGPTQSIVLRSSLGNTEALPHTLRHHGIVR